MALSNVSKLDLEATAMETMALLLNHGNLNLQMPLLHGLLAMLVDIMLLLLHHGLRRVKSIITAHTVRLLMRILGLSKLLLVRHQGMATIILVVMTQTPMVLHLVFQLRQDYQQCSNNILTVQLLRLHLVEMFRPHRLLDWLRHLHQAMRHHLHHQEPNCRHAREV